jgi:hypothetical protein
MDTRTFRIDPEFRDRIPGLSEEAFRGLEADILADGQIFDALKVWKEEGVLLDGHHRYTVAQKHGMAYPVTYVSLPDRETALDWIDRHASDQRNLEPDALALIRGRRYNFEKKRHGGQDRFGSPSGHCDHLDGTAQTLASELGVSEKTIRRDGAFAQAVEKLGISQEVTSGKLEASRSDVVKVAKALPENPTPKQVEKAKKELEAPKVVPLKLAPKPEPFENPEELERLRAENESLKDRLAEIAQVLADTQEELETARRALDAEDLLVQFDKEIKRAQEQARVVQSRNNGLMNENADLKGRLKSALRKIERLEKAQVSA